jgi:hypothetical protein
MGAAAALVAMRDKKRAIADKLSSQEGANAANAAKSARVHEKTIGAHVMNAHVESHFGKADNCMRTYRNATAENIAGMVQQAYNQDFDQRSTTARPRFACSRAAGYAPDCPRTRSIRCVVMPWWHGSRFSDATARRPPRS